MSILIIVVMVLLFMALSPGVFIYIPPGASKSVAALVHGTVFAVIWYFLYKLLLDISFFKEGMPLSGSGPPTKNPVAKQIRKCGESCKPGYTNNKSIACGVIGSCKPK